MSATPSTRRVLVVDDHLDCLALFASVVRDDGCEVRVASTGAEAIIVASKFSPDVVLLDIGLPDMSGYEVARAIRSAPTGADAFIAAVSGHDIRSDRRQAECAGIDMFLVKPVGCADLQVALSGVRGASRSAIAVDEKSHR